MAPRHTTSVTYIYERLLLNCPYVRARLYLPRTFPEKVLNGIPVRYEPSRDPFRFDESWNVYWPDFAGEITLRIERNLQTAALEVTGDYLPRPGSFGKGYDMMRGMRTAAATARSLLREIASSLEGLYRAEQVAFI